MAFLLFQLMMTKGISQLMGSTEAEALFRKECEILNRYNQLTGAHLEPFYPEAAPHPPKKQAVAWTKDCFKDFSDSHYFLLA